MEPITYEHTRAGTAGPDGFSQRDAVTSMWNGTSPSTPWTTPWRMTSRLFLVTQKEISVDESRPRRTCTVLARSAIFCRSSDMPRTACGSWWRESSRARLHRMWQRKAVPAGQCGGAPEEEFPGKITPRVEAHAAADLRAVRRVYGAGAASSATTLSQRCWTAATRDGWRTSSHRTSPCAIRISRRSLEELQPVTSGCRCVNDILTHEVDVLSLEMQMEQKVRQRVAQVPEGL